MLDNCTDAGSHRFKLRNKAIGSVTSLYVSGAQSAERYRQTSHVLLAVCCVLIKTVVLRYCLHLNRTYYTAIAVEYARTDVDKIFAHDALSAGYKAAGWLLILADAAVIAATNTVV